MMWRAIRIGQRSSWLNRYNSSSTKDLLDGAKTSIQHGINLIKTGKYNLSIFLRIDVKRPR